MPIDQMPKLKRGDKVVCVYCERTSILREPKTRGQEHYILPAIPNDVIYFINEDQTKIVTACVSCYTDRNCHRCETHVYDHRMRSHEGSYYCVECYEDIQIERREILKRKAIFHDYSYKPKPIFHTHTQSNNNPIPETLFLGVELESECKNRNVDSFAVSEKLFEMDKKQEKFYLKADGSLSNGIELVTHPGTLAWHREIWPPILEKMNEQELCADTATTCGLHIHSSKVYNNYHEHIKIGLFFAVNKQKLEVFARRKESRYCKFKEINTSSPKEISQAARNWEDRREAVNWVNDHTIEYRIFQSTINYETLIASLELIDAISNFVKVHSITRIANNKSSWRYFCDYISKPHKNSYGTVRAYMVAKNIFETAQ